MSRIRPHTRRALAIAVSALVGLAGAALVASPAHAHHTYVTGTAECPDPDTGEWLVTWRVTSWEPEPRFANVTHYSLDELRVGLEPGGTTTLPVPEDTKPVDEPFIIQQVVPGEVDAVRITRIRASWNNRNTSTDVEVLPGGSKRVEQPAPCEVPPEPSPVQLDAVSRCDGLTIEVANPPDGQQTEVVLTPDTGEAVALSPAPGGSAAHTFAAEGDGLTVVATAGGDELGRFDWEPPADCDAPDTPGEPEQTRTPEPSEPATGEGGGDEELPVTGFQAGMTALGAVLLLLLGAGLFVAARRRRITFTA